MTLDSSLKVRVRSAMIFGPAVLAVLYLGGDYFTLMMAAIAAISVHEWGRMILTGQSYHKWLLNISAGLTALAVLASGLVYNPISMLWLLLGFCATILAFNFLQAGPSLKRLMFGIVYIALSMEVMVWLRNSGEHGLYHMLTLLLIVWASDISAYFSGRAIGGPKLAPVISPKKTWAGFMGSSIGAGVVAAGLACPWLLEKLDVATIGHMSPPAYAVMGFTLAMFGQLGDLFISMFKRHYGVKDTGAIIPGHGGILDRIDALLLVALLFGTLAKVLS